MRSTINRRVRELEARTRHIGKPRDILLFGGRTGLTMDEAEARFYQVYPGYDGAIILLPDNFRDFIAPDRDGFWRVAPGIAFEIDDEGDDANE